MDINLFTAALRKEYLSSMQAVATPAPTDPFTLTVPSTARIERYPWMMPSPGFSRYMGRRRIAQLDQILYSVENAEYDASMGVPLRDIEDDILGGYKLRMSEMTQKAGKPWESRTVLTALANGADATKGICFDGSPFFNTTHNLGGYGAAPTNFTSGGGNKFAFTAAAADGGTYKFCVLIHDKSVAIKPLLFQMRKKPDFFTDAGTPESNKSRFAAYWLHGEGAAAYGYWNQAIQVTVTNMPTILELQSLMDGVEQAFRGFYLPIALDTDPKEYVHEQLTFSPENVSIVTCTQLSRLFSHILNEERIGISVAGSSAGFTNNIYYKGYGLVTTALLNS